MYASVSLSTNVYTYPAVLLHFWLGVVFLDKPPPCNFFYLSECKHGSKCRYGHNYILLTEHVEELRVNSKKWPCPYLNRSMFSLFLGVQYSSSSLLHLQTNHAHSVKPVVWATSAPRGRNAHSSSKVDVNSAQVSCSLFPSVTFMYWYPRRRHAQPWG